MSLLYVNNFKTRLAAPLASGETVMHLESVAGLPAMAPGDNNILLLTIFRNDGYREGNWEVVAVTSRIGNVCQILRSQEGAAPSTFAMENTIVEARMTAGILKSLTAGVDSALALNVPLAAAQREATKGVADAASAQGTANKAVADAATAQGTANKAVADAATAKGVADQAIKDANGALLNGNRANTVADAALPKTGGFMTGTLYAQKGVEVGVATPAALGSALLPIVGTPISGEPREVQRLSVMGIPNVSYGGGFRIFTSTNGLYSDSFLWDMRVHDMNRGLADSVLSVTGKAVLTSRVITALSGNGAARPRSCLGFPDGLEASLSLSRWGGSGVHDKTWRINNDNGVLKFQYADYGQLFSNDQEQHFVAPMYIEYIDQTSVGSLWTDLHWRGRYVIPIQDNTFDVGLPAQCYRTIYARTGTINTSDERLKTDFRTLTDAETLAARDIARAIGVYRWKDSVELKAADAREHIGPTVQKAIAIMQSHGLDPFNYGFICYDKWDREVVEHPAVAERAAIDPTPARQAVYDDEGRVISEAVPAYEGWPYTPAKPAYTEVKYEAGDRYAFRYDELLAFIAAGHEARLTALERK